MNKQEQIDELKREIVSINHVLAALVRSINVAVQDISYTYPPCKKCGLPLMGGSTCGALNSECPSGVGRKDEAQVS